MRKRGLILLIWERVTRGIVIIIAITGVLHIDGRNKGNSLLQNDLRDKNGIMSMYV